MHPARRPTASATASAVAARERAPRACRETSLRRLDAARRGRRRLHAEQVQLGLDDSSVVELRIHRRPGLQVRRLRFGALALRQQDVAAPVVGQGDELGPAGDGVDLLERFFVLLRVEQEAGETQAGDRAVLVVARLVGHPGEAGARGVVLAFLGGDAGGDQAGLVREGRARIALLHVGEDPRRAIAVAGLGGAVELVVERAGFRALVALVQIPAVPGGEAAEHQDEQPGDEVAVLFPERLQLIELFLLFEVEMGGHGFSRENPGL